ncbi:MAG: deoxyribose-phosphate aldolase [Faecalibacterium sp.]|mgnify:FL=1|jgi:deoxyribose-phosphate aldolase|nr:deoxyribose-phosphate aldolase [Faecalibacterium sp.]MDD7571166.1 deoxyribose-phosphate aldolase [Faecalibacterium sp.]MDY3256384.1 deoxyribose-phosphate aldolase [Eubacteriales bacterium]CCY03923.1 deoxyribose-phosphate aldolase [Faecalibacterium sp. CAG:1138]
MEIQKILGSCDHTLLAQTSTWKQIKGICDDGMKYHTASVCIPPCYVKKAKKYVGDNLKICTVIGFPNGYNTTAVKVYETKRAIKDGADEVDMVINIGLVKSRSWKQVLSEIKAVRKASEGKVLKVIIETCLLTDAEKKKMCEIVTESGADFIKTSTGFSKAGATREDIKLFSENIGPNVKMKAAGGISSIEDAEDFIKLGCERLGTSRIVKIVKENEK